MDVLAIMLRDIEENLGVEAREEAEELLKDVAYHED